jgi:hypothetical protein
MSRLAGPLYALRVLGYVLLRPLFLFVDQAVLGHSPLNPKE